MPADFHESVQQTSVKIHPNPSDHTLRVTVNDTGSLGKIQVFDILGKPVLKGKSFDLIKGEATWTHDVSGWKTGTYVVRVFIDGTVVKTLRFVKN